MLFLADIPDQVQLLTIDGKFKMGFRNANGEEAFFTVVDPRTGKPYARLAGPSDTGVVGKGALNGRGYINVSFPNEAGQLFKDGNPVTVTGALNAASITDAAAEFELVSSMGAKLDRNQAPVHLHGNTFRYWTQGDVVGGTLEIIYLKETWSYSTPEGEELFSQLGAFEDENGVRQGETPAPAGHIVARVLAPYIDVRFVPAAGDEFTDAELHALASLGAAAVIKENGIEGRDADGKLLSIQPAVDSTAGIYLGNDIVRYFIDGHDGDLSTDFEAGFYSVTFTGSAAANGHLGGELSVSGNSFGVSTPTVSIAAPVAGEAPAAGGEEIVAIDVNVLNAQQDATGHYIDVIFTPSPGVPLDYASIMDDTGVGADEFSVKLIGGDPLDLSAVPIPVSMEFNDDFVLEATAVTAASPSELIAKLEEDGITRFRYYIEEVGFTEYPTGQLEITFVADSWNDAGGSGGPDAVFLFGIDGPVANLVGPGDNGNIDIGELNNRNYIDVILPTEPGYIIDAASVTDLEAEFSLSGPGLGSIKLDSGQAPIDNQDGSFRYWVNGRFADGTVKAEFIAGSWSFVPDSGPPAPPSVTTITLDDPSYIAVEFDTAPAGFQIDAASITDLEPEFGLSYSGPGSIELVDDEAPIFDEDTNTWRFRVTGDFVADGSQTVTLTFGSEAAWSFTKDDHAPIPATLSESSADNNRTYIDIEVKPSVDTTPEDTPITIAPGTDSLEPADIKFWSDAVDGTQYPGIAPGDDGFTCQPRRQPLPLLPERPVRRRGCDRRDRTRCHHGLGRFQKPADRRVLHRGGSDRFHPGTPGRRQRRHPVAERSRLYRRYLRFPGHRPPKAFSTPPTDDDLGREFTIVAAGTGASYAIELDDTQVPVLIGQTDSSSTFRYWTTGSYTSGTVSVALAANSISNTDGEVIDTDGIVLTVNDPTTVNLTYIDVRYKATEGNVLDVDSIVDSDAEFGLFKDAAGNEDYDAVTPSSLAPVRLTSSNTFRYFYSGDFDAGAVWVRFVADSFLSVATGRRGHPGR